MGNFPVTYIFFFKSYNAVSLVTLKLRALETFFLDFLLCCYSVVLSDSLWPHGLQLTRLPCPSLSEYAQTHVHWVSHPTISSSYLPLLLLPTIFPSIRVFFSESALHIRWPKCWSFSFSISSSSEYSGLTSFRMTGMISLLSKGPLRVFQHHSWEASILQCFAFFMVQLSHLYMTIGKAIALIKWTFVSKLMSLLFNVLSRFIIDFFFQGASIF